MPDDTQKSQGSAAAPAPAPAPAVPQAPAVAAAPAPAPAPAFLPKVGQFVKYTETFTNGTRKGTSQTNIFLVSEVGVTSGPKRDAKGNVMTKQSMVKFGDGERMVTQAIMEDVPVFGGIIISAQSQFTTPKRGILLGDLSALEA